MLKTFFYEKISFIVMVNLFIFRSDEKIVSVTTMLEAKWTMHKKAIFVLNLKAILSSLEF